MNKKIALSALSILPMLGAISSADSYGTINYEFVNVRIKPSMKDAVSFVLKRGDKVQILTEENNWIKIKIRNRSGWIQSDAIDRDSKTNIKKSSKPKYCSVNNDSTQLRFSPSNGSKILKTLKKSDKLKVVDSGVSWTKVEVDSYQGYVANSNISLINSDSKYKMVTTSTLNVRESENVYSKKVFSLRKGDVVELVSQDGGWSKIRQGSKQGYVSSLYLKDTNLKIENKDEAPLDTKDINNPDKLTSKGSIKYVNTGISLSDFANEQIQKSLNTVNDGGYRNVDVDELTKYMNPENYKDSTGMLQFARLDKYTEDITAQQLNKYFAENCKPNSVFQNQGQSFINAARNNNINVLYLVAHSMIETGGGTSTLASGVSVNGEKVYNFFGIGAVDGNALKGGAETAYKNGWNTVEKGINGAANWISTRYIHSSKYSQNTLYSMKWSKDYIWHQYASDVRWPSYIASRMASIGSYSDRLNSLSFEIPKYN